MNNFSEELEYLRLLEAEELCEQRLATKIRERNIKNGGYLIDLSESVQKRIEENNIVSKPVYKLEQARISKNLETLHEISLDQMKEVFNKFTEKVQAMVSKFTEFSKNMVKQNQGYLKRKKNQILEKYPGDEKTPIEMRNYSAGISRIQRCAVPDYEAVKNKVQTPGDRNTCEIEIRKIMIPAYTNANQDFKEFCNAYFLGGSKINVTNMAQINMQRVYSYCMNFDRIIGVIIKDSNTIQKLKNVANKMANNAAQTNKTTINTQQAQINAAGTSNPQAQPMNASYDYSDLAKDLKNIVNEVFNEAADLPPKTTASGMTIGQNPNAQAAQTTDTNTQAQAMNNPQVAADSNLEVQNNIIQAYRTVATQVIGAKMSAASTIYKDYCTLMKNHAPENPKKPTGVTSNSLVINNPQTMAMRIQAIKNMSDKNQQAQATSGLIAEVQKNNPGFNGNLDDILKSIQ